MIETTGFFQHQAEQCRFQAKNAGNKADREFWLNMAIRWEGMLQPEPYGGETEPLRQHTFVRSRRRAGRSWKRGALTAGPPSLSTAGWIKPTALPDALMQINDKPSDR